MVDGDGGSPIFFSLLPSSAVAAAVAFLWGFFSCNLRTCLCVRLSCPWICFWYSVFLYVSFFVFLASVLNTVCSLMFLCRCVHACRLVLKLRLGLEN